MAFILLFTCGIYHQKFRGYDSRLQDIIYDQGKHEGDMRDNFVRQTPEPEP
jgi:hypothetical protein